MSHAAQTLVGRTFRIVEAGGVPALETPTAELTFDADGRVTGRATVNRVFGPCTMDAGTVRFGPLGTTLMAGPQEAMDQERRVLEALRGELSVSVDADDRVALSSGGDVVLVLVPADEVL
ncbi:MAG: META domain-containing protein [Frankiales bacterium]|nr:META domain-containing protein [Frankiales bacterium]